MSKHTPGPWKADIRTGVFAICKGEESHNCLSGCNEYAIAAMDGQGEHCGGDPLAYKMITNEQEANARLIAAAPELLEALTDLVGGDGKEGDLFSTEAMDKARAAIAKARGE